jgi:Ribbon-helix-helix protein, copG family
LKTKAVCVQIVCVKTITYPLRLDKPTYRRVEFEAKRRKRSKADIFRDAIGLGLTALPPIPDAGMERTVADTWEKLGPAPEIDYDKL